MTYKTKGTCSTEINLEIKNGIIGEVSFVNGCNGNLKAISQLVKGMDANEAMIKLKGIHCGFKQTSCADQLANAISAHLTNN